MADNPTTVKLGMLPVNRGSYTTGTWPQNIVIYKDNIVQFNGSSYIYLPANFNLDNPAASATSDKPYNSVPSSLNPGWQVFADGNNQFTTSQRVTELGIDSVPTSGHTNYLVTSDGVADAVASSNAKVGYYECATEGSVADKVVSASDYVLSTGGSFKIKMTKKNTAASGVTLNINSTGAKALYYDGELVTDDNTWDANEVVDVYYDGTSYYANNVSGGGKFLTGEKVKEVGIDSTPTANSDNLVTSGGVASSLEELDAAIDEQLEDMNNTIDGVVESTEQRIDDLINTLADVFEKCVFTEDATAVLAPLFTINFADAAVKAICVANWDTDGNGQLSRQEAAAVTTLASKFNGNTNITSFNELKYFTGITALESASAANHISRDFKGCTSLESITLPSGLITLGSEAFQNCSSLESITIPEGVTIIRTNTFNGCTSLTEVNVEGDLTEIGSSALKDTAIAWTEIPDTVTTLGISAFKNCPNIRISYLPANIAESTHIFDGSGITAMELAEEYSTIDTESFDGCASLANVILPSTITSLGNKSFRGCSALASFTIKATTPPTMGTQVFFTTNNTFKIYVPAASVDTYKAASGWSDYASRIEAITE